MRQLETLEQRTFFAVDYFAVGSEAGSPPIVRVFDAEKGKLLFAFFAYDPSFQGGVRVAVGDVTGDGTTDIITGAGPGGGPHVKVFDGNDLSTVRSFFAFDAGFTGGVTVASGDINNDSFDDIIVGAGPGGGPHVKVFSGKDGSELASFFAFDPSFSGGVNVASGHVNRDEFDDIIVGAGPGAGPHVKVFSGADLSLVHSFFAFDAGFAGGVFVAAGDVNGDGFDDLITGAGPGGGGHVKIFDALDLHVISSFFAFGPNFAGGAPVTVINLGGGDDELVVGTVPLEKTRVLVFDPTTGEVVDKFKVKGIHKKGRFSVG